MLVFHGWFLISGLFCADPLFPPKEYSPRENGERARGTSSSSLYIWTRASASKRKNRPAGAKRLHPAVLCAARHNAAERVGCPDASRERESVRRQMRSFLIIVFEASAARSSDILPFPAPCGSRRGWRRRCRCGIRAGTTRTPAAG